MGEEIWVVRNRDIVRRPGWDQTSADTHELLTKDTQLACCRNHFCCMKYLVLCFVSLLYCQSRSADKLVIRQCSTISTALSQLHHNCFTESMDQRGIKEIITNSSYAQNSLDTPTLTRRSRLKCTNHSTAAQQIFKSQGSNDLFTAAFSTQPPP
jgi:hypothetical protein